MSPDFDFDYEDDGPDDEDDYDPGEECGRWRNGRLAPYGECLQAGTEFCDWDCPYARSRQASPLPRRLVQTQHR